MLRGTPVGVEPLNEADLTDEDVAAIQAATRLMLEALDNQ